MLFQCQNRLQNQKIILLSNVFYKFEQTIKRSLTKDEYQLERLLLVIILPWKRSKQRYTNTTTKVRTTAWA